MFTNYGDSGVAGFKTQQPPLPVQSVILSPAWEFNFARFGVHVVDSVPGLAGPGEDFPHRNQHR